MTVALQYGKKLPYAQEPLMALFCYHYHMAKIKQTSLFMDSVMFLFGVSQLVFISAYMLSAKSPSSPDYKDGFYISSQDGLAINIVAGVISLAYFLFVSVLTALSASNLLKKVHFRLK